MKRVIIAILVLATTANCRRSDIHAEQNGTLALSSAVANFDEFFPQRPAETQSRAATKADATDFPVGQTLGLYLHTATPIGTAAACHSQNIEYATPDGGTTWNQRASLDAPLADGTTYYATAYSPFVEGAFEPTAMALAVETDQSTGDALERSDLRIAKNIPITGSGDAFTATLNFTHALSMFELKLLIPQMVEGREVDQIETISFENMATKGSINLATGAVTTDLSSVATVKPRIVSGTGAIGVLTTYQAIVVPQNVDGGVLLAKIRCRMKDGSTETMDYVTPSNGWISFRAGVKTSITLLPTAEAAFMGDLPQLMDGQAHTDLALPIFVETGLRWTVDAPGCDWLSLADASGGTYGQKLSGTSATGAWQNIYVKVSANTSQTMPRTGDLILRAWRADGSEVTAAVLRLVQNYYAFAPVGRVWNTSAAAASDPVEPFASNQQWTAESNAPWLLLATSSTPGSGNPVRKFVQSGALEAGKLYVQVTQNTSATARRGVVTISSPVAGATPMKIYVNQVGNQPYVEIGGLRWATGNLVATRSSVDGVSAPGCMIGAPDDGGLYFQFGSLIGWKGGAAEHGGTGIQVAKNPGGGFWNGAAAWSWANDAMVWPSNMSGKPTSWPKDATTNQWYFGLQSGWSTQGQTIRDFPGLVSGSLSNVGVGDPCTYYLGGTWRLPTTNEQTSITGKGGNAWLAWVTNGLTSRWVDSPEIIAGISGPGAWFGPGLNANSGTPNPSVNPFLPASMARMSGTGAFSNTALSAYSWSSSIYIDAYGYALLARSGQGIVPQHNSLRSAGAPVRCVQPVPTVPNPPAESDYVEINGLYWAKGNLVATNNTNAKVGKPEDGGLYFQFGSLIGWKGGALANGGTGVGIPPYTGAGTQWWGGASAWSWGNDAGLWPDKLEGQPTAWPQGATTNQWYFGLQSGWSTAEQNIRDFPGLVAGNLADKGVGDPCTYYLGGTWRLPTTNEYVTLCNNQGGGGWVPWATVGGSWTTSPTYGGNFSSNRLFFPALGYRHNSNGSFYGVTTTGTYWSSSVYNATGGYYLNFTQPTGVIPQNGNGRSLGFPVRCVKPVPTKPTPPAPSDYVEINGLKWAKGNLVATGPHNAKVGAPADYGIYFQFGSLIGWTGGATGNGVGQGSPALSKAVWPEAMGPTMPNFAWQNNGAANVGTLNNYYFNYSAAPWETGEKNIRDFAEPISGDSGSGTLATGRYAKKGVGDPCTYYLGGAWRLPTSAELVALCNNQRPGYNVPIAWGSCNASWTTSPINGGNFSSNKLFFPAGGCRHYSNGSWNLVTMNGIFWSSSTHNGSTSSGLALSFVSSEVYPQHHPYRSTAYPVRCVSE